jgi:nicotinamide phosphoribosyltransferase
MLNTRNIILNTDSYKFSHWLQYPEGTEFVYSYVESRGGEYDQSLFFGLQAFILEYLTTPITMDMINEAEEVITAHGYQFNREGWEYILKTYNGQLPIEIRAVPEGTVVPTRNVLATIVNTDPNCYWLPSYLETAFLRSIWYPTTVATRSWNMKQLIKSYLEKTSDDQDQIAFKLHDFGARGASSMETAALGGAAHIINFMGTDTVTGILAAKTYYYAKDMPAFSVPAMEHSTVTSWGRDKEVDSYRNMLRHYAKPGAIVAIVSDSYSFSNAVTHIWGEVLKQEVVDSGALLVVRPDSGDPVQTPIWAIQELDKTFGSIVNSKGYKVLNNVRVLQGDGIGPATVSAILSELTHLGYATDNVTFGMGGGLLQQVNRDTQKFAMKASAICINGKWQDVWKQPEGDTSKASKRGKLALIKEHSGYRTVPLNSFNRYDDLLRTVFYNGEPENLSAFEEVRNRSNS